MRYEKFWHNATPETLAEYECAIARSIARTERYFDFINILQGDHIKVDRILIIQHIAQYRVDLAAKIRACRILNESVEIMRIMLEKYLEKGK